MKTTIRQMYILAIYFSLPSEDINEELVGILSQLTAISEGWA